MADLAPATCVRHPRKAPASDQAEPVASAQAAGFRHVSDRRPGIRRRRAGQGFVYRDAKDRPIPDPATPRRIAAERSPPTWPTRPCAEPPGQHGEDRQQGDQGQEEPRPAGGGNDHPRDVEGGLAYLAARAVGDPDRTERAVGELAIGLVDQSVGRAEPLGDLLVDQPELVGLRAG